MLKIGDFSKLSQVSIKALRHYDQLGLLKPIDVDQFTGYRYYSATQLPRLNRILAFKDLGFSLEQIAKLLDENLNSAEIRGMLRLKQAELQQLVAEEQARLLRIETRLQQIEQENIMSNYDVVLKSVEAIKVASIRDTLPNYPCLSQLYGELFTYFHQQGVKVKEEDFCAAILHDPGYKESDVDVEAVMGIYTNLPSNDRVKVYELPSVEKMACLLHQGSYQKLMQTYNALVSWIENNGYKIIDSNREVYIIGGPEQDNESYITELQFPVTKA